MKRISENNKYVSVVKTTADGDIKCLQWFFCKKQKKYINENKKHKRTIFHDEVKTVKMNNDNKKLQSNMCILNKRILRKL